MDPGQTVGGRFVIEALAGRGGMGAVYRAFDTRDGSPVAIKVLDLAIPEAVSRFEREAQVLSQLAHESIVRFIGRGDDRGTPWLAMEWLVGRDLGATIQLESGRLALHRALRIGVAVASALECAHRVGVVHRDIKPSNIFLTSDERVIVIDFGIAQLSDPAERLTRTGQFLGTAGYMAPEQIAGSRDLDARADVFALGCVLFECVTGQPAFPGASSIAIIAKIMADDPVPPGQLVPGVPPAFDHLIARMLAKSADARPADMATVGAELVQLQGADSVVAGRRFEHMTRREQTLVGVVLAALDENDARHAELTRATADIHAKRHALGGGQSLFVLGGPRAADEHAVRAAECALRIVAAAPEARVAIATGLADSEMLAVGPAIDRCVELLGRHLAPGIFIDAATVRLLHDRFETAVRDGDVALLGRAHGAVSGRAERQRRFVGREKELAYLTGEVVECLEEPRSRALLVLGDAGAGKSMLISELVRRTVLPRARVLEARANALGAGSAMSVARQLVAAASGVAESSPSPDAHRDLAEYVGSLDPQGDSARITDFLGELMRLRPREQPSPEFAAARGEPRIGADWMRRSYVEWLSAEARKRPLVILVEDLHWSDPATVLWIGQALRAASRLPLLALASARLEVHERLPDLRAELEPQEIRLSPLSRKAAQSIVRAHLGAEADADIVDRIVEIAAGNPFFVEELSRSGASDRTLASTLLAVLQARLGALEPNRRRLLRAASVFGRTFGTEGVAALLGGESRDAIESELAALASEEITERIPGRSSPDAAWAFRHDLLRDAAYATIPDDERRTGHRLAGAFLEARASVEPLILADHFERARAGGRPITSSLPHSSRNERAA